MVAKTLAMLGDRGSLGVCIQVRFFSRANKSGFREQNRGKWGKWGKWGGGTGGKRGTTGWGWGGQGGGGSWETGEDSVRRNRGIRNNASRSRDFMVVPTPFPRGFPHFPLSSVLETKVALALATLYS